jgi:Xaa-Pro aminopeptidase
MSDLYARGPFQVDYQARVDFAALRAYRWERIRSALADTGLDALLLWKDENVRYVTDLRPQIIAGKSGYLNGCLFVPGHAPVLFVSGGDYDRAKATMPWLGEIHPVPIMEEPGLIRHIVESIVGPTVRHLGLAEARIGVDAGVFAFFAALREGLPTVRWEDGDRPMQIARRIKGREELLLIEEATVIAEAVTEAAVAAAKPGVRECEVAGEAMRTLYRLGGEYSHVTSPFVASGENMAPPQRLATDKVIRHGDLVFVDIGAMWNGYFGDVGRTVVVGAPSSEQRRVFRAVHEALWAGIEAIRPGATNAQVAAAIRRAAERHGLERHFLSLFIGHGVGIGSNEPPYVGENFPGAEEVILEEGMVFALEPLIWLPGVRGGAGVRLEDMVTVTADGCRVISRLPYDERLLG